jgi:DNA-binding transcriptional LysR family regulator
MNTAALSTDFAFGPVGSTQANWSGEAMSDSLEFRLLKYIVAVAETFNFTRAAERLFLAQPSLSKQIRDLEDDIGFPIFDRTRDGVRITPAGEMVYTYAVETLRSREELLTLAKAVARGDVPPLRLGFSSFVNGSLLQEFKETYCQMFRGCQIQLSGGDPVQILQRISQRSLDCAILSMPIDNDLYRVQQISSSPMVVCMKRDDPLASETEVELRQIAERLKIYRAPELQPAAHLRLVELFAQEGIPLHVDCSASTPSHIQWMVNAGYGLALLDQLTALEPGLTMRPISDVNWTVDNAFVFQNLSDHIALPFIERSLAQRWRESTRKKRPSASVTLPAKKRSA